MAVRDGVVCIVTRSTAHFLLGSDPRTGTCEGFGVRGRLYTRTEPENGNGEVCVHLHRIAAIQVVASRQKISERLTVTHYIYHLNTKLTEGSKLWLEHLKAEDHGGKEGVDNIFFEVVNWI